MIAISEGTFAIWGYGPKSGITDGHRGSSDSKNGPWVSYTTCQTSTVAEKVSYVDDNCRPRAGRTK